MATTSLSLDGAFSLQELQQTIITEENLGFKRLTGLQKRDIMPPANMATFEDIEGVDPIPAIILIALKAGDDVDAIAATQKAKGKKLLFQAQIYLQGSESEVAAFR